MRLVPLGSRVIVRPIEGPPVSSLIIPDTAKKVPVQGKIIAVGPAVMLVSVDDIVMYGKYSGTEIEVGKETLICLMETDVMCQVEET